MERSIIERKFKILERKLYKYRKIIDRDKDRETDDKDRPIERDRLLVTER